MMKAVVRKTRKRFANDQIVEFLKQAENGVSVKELCRKNGFTDTSFYRWRDRLRSSNCAPANDKEWAAGDQPAVVGDARERVEPPRQE